MPERHRRRFRGGLRLARDAARRLVQRRDLLLAVIVLAAAGSVPTTLIPGADHLHRSIGESPAGRPTGVFAFVERWRQPYVEQEFVGVVWLPASAYMAPLKTATALMALAYVPSWRHVQRSGDASRWWDPILMVGGWGISFLLLVGLLGWIRDSDKPIRLSALPGYWRRHVLEVVLVSVLAMAVLWVLGQATIGGAAGGALAAQLAMASSVVPYIAFFLAPFVVVGRQAGASEAIVEGWRLLRDNWAALLVLFVVYRMGYEFLSAFAALTPWEASPGQMYAPDTPAGFAWNCAYSVGFGVLGLWVAYAFMQIARSPKTAPANE
jgi:hypothetical protein